MQIDNGTDLSSVCSDTTLASASSSTMTTSTSLTYTASSVVSSIDSSVYSDNNNDNENNNNNNNNNNNQNNNQSKPKRNPQNKPSVYSSKNYNRDRANKIIVDGLNFYIEFFNSSIADIITKAAPGKWTSTIEALMPDYFFNQLWNDTNWIGSNGDYLSLIKFDNIGRSTKKPGGYLPVAYVWDKLNNGKIILGVTDARYINNIHTFDIYRSPETLKTILTMQFEKRHVDAKVWNLMRAPKTQP